MGFRVASASDYADLLKTSNKNSEGISQWEQYFLQPLQESYETAGKQISAQTSYDISSAYANYKKQQLNILQNQTLGTGFKEQVGSDLLSQYQSEYATAQSEGSEKLLTLQQQYQKALATEEQSLLERGEKLRNIENYLWEFGGVDTSKIEELGYVKTVPGGYELTEKGIDYFDQMMNKGKEYIDKETNQTKLDRFSDYLAEADPELYDFYVKNIEDVREVVGGLSRSDVTYSPEERAYKTEADEYKQKLIDLADTKIQSQELKDLYKDTKSDFATHEEARDYYKERYENLTSKKSTVEAGSTSSKDITSALKIDNKLRSGELHIGDIIEYNGQILKIASKTYKGIQYDQLNTTEEAHKRMEDKGYVYKRDPWTDKWKWVKK